MSNELTYMDCWHFVAPLIPVDTDYTMDIYVMVFNALKEAEKKRIAEKKKGRKLHMTRKRFIKLLMGKLLLSRNEANYIADIVRICDRREP